MRITHIQIVGYLTTQFNIHIVGYLATQSNKESGLPCQIAQENWKEFNFLPFTKIPRLEDATRDMISFILGKGKPKK